MSKYIENMHTIHNNLFVLTPLIVEFYQNLDLKHNNILLAYLVLPLVLFDKSRQTLLGAKTTSSIHTFLDSKNRDKRENVYGLPQRVQEYKNITNKCIQYAVDNNWIKINDDLSVKFLSSKSNEIENLKDSFKASSNLHKIFKDLDVIAIYRLLGVKEL